MNSLVRFGIRSSVGRPGRTILTILSVVIGVASYVAVTISTQTTRSAYRTMFSAVTGKAALEVSGEGNEGFETSLTAEMEKLRSSKGEPVVQGAAPLIYRPCMLLGGKRIKGYVLGIDPIRDKKVRDFKIAKGHDLKEPDDVLVDAAFARKLKVEPGDEIKLVGTSRGIVRLNVVGLVTPNDGSAIRYGGMAIMNLAKAQDAFRLEEKCDRLQIVTNPAVPEEEAQRLVNEALPTGLRAAAPAVNTEVMKETLLSSEEGLKLSRAFTMLLGVFIIFNTFLMNVGERRRQLAVLRAIGGTRGQLVRLLVGEALVLGIIGGGVGILAGYLGALLLNWAQENLVQVMLPPTPFSIRPVVEGFAFGILVALVGVLVPAFMVARVTPLEGMRDVTNESRRSIIPYVIATGFLIIAVSATLTLLSIYGMVSIEVASYGGVGMVFGHVLLAPLVTGPFAYFVQYFMRPFLKIESRLALRQLLRHKLRTSLTMGVLFVAGSTGVGMASSMLDNVENVRAWSRTAIIGDFFVRSMMPDAVTGLSAELPAEIGERLKTVGHVTNLDAVSFVSGRVLRTEGEKPVIVVVRDYSSEDEPPFDLIHGDKKSLRERLYAGDVVIGSVLAQRENLKLGELLPLAGKEGTATNVRIAGIANDYLVGGLSVYMQRAAAKKLLGVSGVNAYIVRVEPAYREQVQKELEALTDEYEVLLQSYTDLTTMIDGMIRGVDACLWGLVILGFVVAAFGVVNTLTMNVLEQTRELGLLRITGMTRRQVMWTVLSQAIILGLIGATPGIFAGIGTALMMNMAMEPSLGHKIEFTVHPGLLLAAWAGSMTVVLISAWIPAKRAAGLDVTNALHYE